METTTALPAPAPADLVPAEALDPTTRTPGFCGCGCGARVARRYLPGHDAKHHSTLAAALRGPWRQAARAADLLAHLGWTSYADRADLRAVPYRNHRGHALPLIEDVEIWQVDTAGVHHARRDCPALCAHARRHGQTRTGGICRDRHIRFVPNTPDLADRLAHSWDSCTACTTATTRDVDAEHTEIGQATIVAAHTEPKAPKLTARQAKQGGWTVQPDRPGAPTIVYRLDPAHPRDPRKATRQEVPPPPPAWGPPTGPAVR